MSQENSIVSYGDESMMTYQNIDTILKDVKGLVAIGDSLAAVYARIPQTSDEVSLDTDQGYSMVVEVTWISENKEILRGVVTSGYYPKDESKWIEVGASVEFSKKKVGGIFRKESDDRIN